MHWIIQTAVIREERYQDMVDTLVRFDIPHTLVKVIPFAHTLEPDVDVEGPVMTMGTVSLTNKIAKRKGWKPGAYVNENFDFRVWSEKWKGHILNEDAVVGTFRDVELPWEPFFVRPVLDSKAFSGQVMWTDEYNEWRKRLLAEEGASDLCFDIDEIVCVAPTKDIYREMRFFIVDGKVITATVYKIGEKVIYQDEGFIDRQAFWFVAERTNEWSPDRAFALDVALTADGYKIIEINCINSSGFYKADVQKIVLALNDIKNDT